MAQTSDIRGRGCRFLLGSACTGQRDRIHRGPVAEGRRVGACIEADPGCWGGGPALLFHFQSHLHPTRDRVAGRTSVSAGGATWVVAGVPGNLGVFSDDPSLSGTVDLSSLRLTSVPVSITVSLFASTGSVAVTDASVHVELLPLPPDSIAP